VAQAEDWGAVAELWRQDKAGFELYQKTQQVNRPVFRSGSIWASFVSPAKDETIFVGLYDARFDGTRVITSFERAMARLVSHEIDHLDGRLYVDRMAPGTNLVPVEEYRQTGQPWSY